MNTVFLFLFFLFGLIFGTSFKLIAQLPTVGFMLRGGRRKDCGRLIIQYGFFVELATGLLFAQAYYARGDDPLELLVALSLVSLCVIVSVCDLLYMRIPNAVLLFFLPLLVVLRILSRPDSLAQYLIAGIAGFLFMLLLALMKPGAMGMGDVKLFGLLGLVIGWRELFITFFLASLIGLIAAIVLMVRGRARRKDSIPFGPALCIGTLLTYFWGNELINGYYWFTSSV